MTSDMHAAEYVGRCSRCGQGVRTDNEHNRGQTVVGLWDGKPHRHPDAWQVVWPPEPQFWQRGRSTRHAAWSIGIAVAVIVIFFIYSIARYGS